MRVVSQNAPDTGVTGSLGKQIRCFPPSVTWLLLTLNLWARWIRSFGL